MKKNRMARGTRGLLKVLMLMKLCVFLILVFTLQTYATKTYSQRAQLTFQLKNVKVLNVLNEIENSTDFYFLFNKDMINVDRIVSVSADHEGLDVVLNNLFEGTNVRYVISDRQIVLTTEGLASGSAQKQQQQQTINGKVTDNKGQPLPGVTVVVKGTTHGGITDSSGNYSLEDVSPNAVLVFSFVGMAPQEVLVDGKSNIDVSMREEAIGIEEVVAIGYGTQKRETLTGSISTVKSEEILKAPVINVSNSLGGKLPGLVAVTGSGEPGYDGTTLRIRGSNTLNDNGVLIVVDGVPGRSLDRIDPNSIESVTVLKDASAAIYGSRAANGVILITTKRGKLGKPELTFNADFGFNQPTRLPELTDAPTYATMLNEIEYYAHPENGMNQAYSDEQIQKFRDGSDPLLYPNTDWFKTVLKDWSSQTSQNVNLSGGTEAMKYFVSIGAKYQDGNYNNSATNYHQYNFQSNIDGKVTKDIHVGFDVSGRLEEKNTPIRSAGEIYKGLMQSYPTSVAIWPNGEPGPAIENGRNPVATSTDIAGRNRDKYYNVAIDLKLDINIPWVKGLSFNGDLSFDQGFDFTKNFSKPFKLYTLDHVDENGNPVLNSQTYGGGAQNTPSLKESFSSSYGRLVNGVLNYQTNIGEKHDLKLMVGAEVANGNYESFNAYRDLFLSTAIEELFAGGTANLTNDGSGGKNSRVSYFGRANYSFVGKYLVEFIGRYDGSYIFAEGNRFGFFPGVSLGWITSEESFWKDNLSFINFFKLRGSWGQTGNDRVGDFQYLARYKFREKYQPFVTYSGSLTENKAMYEDKIANPDITWEVANQSNIGFNARLLNNKLSVEADYFYYKRSNILLPQDAVVPKSAGLVLPDVNFGKVSNQGFDGTITYQNATSSGFSYSVSANAGYSKNKVLEKGETPGVPVWQQETGHPMGSGKFFIADGIYHTQAEIDADNLTYDIGSQPAPGDIKFVDQNDDHIINDDDKVRIYKNGIPTLTFGSNIDLNYKNFDLSIFIQGATGGVLYLGSEAGKFGNYLQSFADERWTPDNTTANGPRTFNRGDYYWASKDNTYWLRKTDYVRLKTLQLGYTFPSTLLQKTSLEKLRVYVSGYNLLTYSPDMKDFDPEIGSNTGLGTPYTNGYNYPLQRIVSVGLQVGF